MPFGSTRLGFWFPGGGLGDPAGSFDRIIPVSSDNYTLSQLGTPQTANQIVANPFIRYTVNATHGALGDGGSIPGLQYDPTGTGNYGGTDYIAPGIPWETYTFLAYSSSLNTYISGSNAQQPANQTATKLWLVEDKYVVTLKGQVSTGFVTCHYRTIGDEPVIRMLMIYTNSTSSPVTVKAMRAMDPDVDSFVYSSASTINQRGVSTVSPNQIVYSLGPQSAKAVSLYIPPVADLYNETTDILSKVTTPYNQNTAVLGSWPTYDIDNILSGVNDGNGDHAIGGAWNVGTVQPNQSVLLYCYWVCGNDIEEAINIITG